MQTLLKALLARVPLLAALALTVALAFPFTSPLAAAPGDVDTSFVTQLTGSGNGSVSRNSVAVQPDGKILIGINNKFSHFSDPALVRLNIDGTEDTSFSANIAGSMVFVNAIVVLDDGRIIIGGHFDSVNGTPRYALARLHADGSLDHTFASPLTNYSYVSALFPQPDGNLLVGGFDLTSNSGVGSLVRLLPYGTLDPSFTVDIESSLYTAQVYTLALQTDGKIIFGGFFDSVSGAPRSNLACVEADGTLDDDYAPTFSDGVTAIALQPDGKLVVGGGFLAVNNTGRERLARLNVDGSLDPAFNPGADSFALSLVLQTNGQLLYSGSFSNTGGSARKSIARLDTATAALDPAFTPKPDKLIYGLALESDGSPIIVGGFTTIGQNPFYSRYLIARLLNAPATETLDAPDSTTVKWLRGGSAPESDFVSFALSTDSGATWSPLGSGTRISGGWELTGLSLPGHFHLRARARTVSGQGNGSSGLVETIVEITLPTPEITVSGGTLPVVIPTGSTALASADDTLFDPIPVAAGSATHTFTIGNLGDALLTVTSVTSSLPGEFTVGNILLPAGVAGGSVTFNVLFNPALPGPRTATITLASNDPLTPSYTFLIGGEGLVFPDIALSGGTPAPGLPIPAGDTSPDAADGTDFGLKNIATGPGAPRTFTLTNSGDGPLTVTAITSLAPSEFIVSGLSLPFTIAPGDSAPFTVAFDPAAVGPRTTDITIASDDADSPSYSFRVTGAGGLPDIAVTGLSVLITAGDTSPTPADDTAFGAVALSGSSYSHVFTVVNEGTAPLLLTGAPLVQLSGSHPGDFNLTQPSLTSLDPGESTTFTVLFTPAALGSRTATVTVASNDLATPSYTFLISGEGVILPDIAISGGTPAQAIPDGDTFPDSADKTDFGLLLINTALTQTFTITNSGDAPLNLASITSSNPSRFSSSAPVLTTLAPSSTTTFTVTFLAPATPGYHTATITVASDDPDAEASYTFTVEAQAAPANLTATGPGGGTIGITNGATSTTPANGTAFGSVLVCATPFSVSHTFTLTNLGVGTINLSGTPLVSMSGAHPNDFLVTQFPVQTALTGPSGATTFTVMFNPSATGQRTAIVSVPTSVGAYSFALSGTGLAPDIFVLGGPGPQLVPDGSTSASVPQGTDFGTLTFPGTPVSQTFTILNSGTAPLNLTNNPPVQIAGLHPSDFTVTTQPVTPIAPGDSATFTVTFIPTTIGVRTATVRILNDDCSDDLYTFAVRGQSDGPAIIVQDGVSLTTIAAGDLAPTSTDRTDFGGAALFNAVGPHYFDIVNLGNTSLSVSSITLAGPHPTDFLVVGLPSPLPANLTTILPGSTNRKFFSVFFRPTLPGTRTAHIVIASSDPSIPSYIYAVQGNGLGSPEIAVTSPNPNVVIPHASSTPATTDGTDFGVSPVGSSTARSFSIRNVTTNTAQLHLTGTPLVSVTGPNGLPSPDFSVTLQPALATIPVSGATPFQITFTPTPGSNLVRNALVTIPNDDADEAPYTFAISGRIGQPGILVQGNSTPITSGDSSPNPADFTDLGLTLLTNSTSRPFVLQNPGSAPLIISAATVINSEFTVTFNSALPVTVPAFSSVPFTVQLNPVGATGVRNGTVQLTHNVSSAPYTFAVRGTSVPWAQWRPDMRVLGNATLISDGDTSPINTDHTHFGTTGVSGGLVVRTYTIENPGPLTLNLTGNPRVAIVGGDFTVTQQPAASVAPGASTTFAVTFNPSAPDARNATVSIANNDTAPGKNPYTFAIRGTGKKWWWTGGGFTLGHTLNAWLRVPDILSGGERRMESVDEGGLTFGQPRAFSFGLNSLGQLGTGAASMEGSTGIIIGVVAAAAILPGQSIPDLAAGENHGIALSASGTVLAWGDNSLGQLGTGTTTSSLTPVAVSGLGGPTGPANIVHLASGRSHSLALAEDGRIFAWGSNNSGQLGNGSTSATLFPVLVNRTGPISSHPVVALAGGEHHSVALSSTGAVFTWGANTRGQLGTGTTTPSSVPVPVNLGGRTAVSVFAGPAHTFILTADGLVFGWGRNDSGQLGDGTTTDRLSPVPLFTGGPLSGRSIVALATGGAHTLALTADGCLVAWGDNSRGQLGLGTTLSSFLPVAIPGFGPDSGFGIRALAAGPAHSAILTADSRLFACGDNTYGQLGIGTFAASFAPVPVALGEITPGSRLDRVVSGCFASRTHLIARAPAPSASLGANDSPDFGRTPLGGSLVRTFSIANSGLASLSLTGDPRIVISGPHASDFMVSQPATSVIAPGGKLTFTVTFTPSGTGPRTGVLSVATNDPANPVITFAINGDTTTAGAPDPAWTNPGLNSGVRTVAVQPDGGILFGGIFTTANPGMATPRRLARLDPSGVLDPAFNPDINGPVHALAVQLDGSALVGGDFTSIGGQPRSRLARILPDGTTDPRFAPGCDGPVHAFAIQPDGGIIVAGAFTTIDGVACLNLARLFPNGTLDRSFAPAPNRAVYALALQPDGKTLLGGNFDTVSGTPRSRIARLHRDGTLDTAFAPSPNSDVTALLVQPDGGIVFGGQFTTVSSGASGPMARLRIARATSNGFLDSAFQPAFDSAVYSLALQTNGTLVVAGAFTTLDTVACSRIARLNTNGTRDTTFAGPYPIDDTVRSVALQSDGCVVLGGDFVSVGGTSRPFLTRLDNDPASDVLSTPSATSVLWLRSGASPAISAVRFDRSLDGGLSWSYLGTGTRNPTGGWELTGCLLSGEGLLRARGCTVGGGCSPGVVESVSAFSHPGIPAAPTVLVAPVSSQTIPEGGIATLSVVASGFPVPSYQWLKLGGAMGSMPISGATASTFTIPRVSLADAGNYRVLVSNASGTALSIPVAVVVTPVNDAPVIHTQPMGRSALRGDFVTLSVIATGKPAPSFQWFKNGDPLPGGVGTTLTFRSAHPADSGLYTVVVTNSVTSRTSAPAILAVGTPPLITSATSATFLTGINNQFHVTASGDPAPTFGVTGLPAWAAFNSTTGALSGTPTAADTSGSPHTLQFTATNTAGTSAPQTFTLHVKTRFQVWREATFTPEALANPALSGPDATPHGDGVSNLLRFALGNHPWMPVIGRTPDGTLLTLRYSRPALNPGVRYEVETSTDLGTWTPEGVELMEISNDGTTSTWQATAPAAPRSFLHLKLSVQ
jgi:uncharacterized delta-60 repeat protein